MANSERKAAENSGKVAHPEIAKSERKEAKEADISEEQVAHPARFSKFHLLVWSSEFCGSYPFPGSRLGSINILRR